MPRVNNSGLFFGLAVGLRPPVEPRRGNAQSDNSGHFLLEFASLELPFARSSLREFSGTCQLPARL